MKDYWNHAYRIDPGIKSAKDRAEQQRQERKKQTKKFLKDRRKK